MNARKIPEEEYWQHGMKEDEKIERERENIRIHRLNHVKILLFYLMYEIALNSNLFIMDIHWRDVE